MKIGAKKIGVGLLLLAVVLALGALRPGVPQDSSEAAITTVGGITAAPSGLPGLPTIINQVLPAIAPASGPGSVAVVGLFCDDANPNVATIQCADAEQGVADNLTNVTFTIQRVLPPGTPAATFVANGMQTLKCEDGSTCDSDGIQNGSVFVQVTGGGVNELVNVTATDESGDARVVRVIFVETIFAVSPEQFGSSGTAIAASIISYRCPDVGSVGLDWQDWLVDVYTNNPNSANWLLTTQSFLPKAGELFYMCGGDTSSPVDDRVNLETDKGILTVEEPADIAGGLGAFFPNVQSFTLNTSCDSGDSVDVLDSPAVNAASGAQLCDLDYAPNGVVSYGLLGTGDVGVASVTAQQSGGGGVLRTINVSFSGEAVVSLFIEAPALVGTSGAEFQTIIVDQDGRPIPNETVECSVVPTGGALIIVPQTGTSDANGVVTFTMVPTGASVVAGEELTINCHLDSNPDVKASETVNLAQNAELEAVDLVEGCNPVASTYPDGTAAADAADGVAPPEALDAIWNFDAASGTWQGFSPSAPADVSDLESIDFLDAIFICTNAAATWSRPVI